MHPLKNISKLITPSTASIALSLVLTVVIVGAGLWFTDIRTGVLFNALTFGSNAPDTTITTSLTTINQLNDRIFGNELLNKFLFYGLWLMIGCLVYVLVSAIIAFGGESVEAVEEMKYVNASRAGLERVFLSRLGTRIIAIILEVLYSLFFLRLILPYSTYAIHVGVNQTQLLPALGYIGLGTAVLMAGWHVHVVLIRLVALKTRLFESN